ncbi:MAG: hypothetical protein FJZ96_05270 [Chloroflexi bacterium]|nr:hypothetical protein [Chloroflexota bacterium]
MTIERGALLHKRYRIVEILGQGGMGSVYRAVDENLGVEVAVKENLFTTDEYARQFRLEAVILANLRHPNLPRVTDHFVIGDQGQYLVMDYIEGEDLRQRMERQGTISEEEAILIGASMCDALAYLHTRKPPILHRDVKPGNVKITSEGHIHLVDFGLAKVVKGSQATTTGARAMTPGYSPPEQYGTARTDSRTDIYSLGATLYAALTGVIPEDGLARAMDSVDLTPLRKRNARISKRLASAIEKAMAVKVEDRYQTADEFKGALLYSNVKTQRLEGELLVTPPPTAHGDEDIKEPPDKPITAQLMEVAKPPSRPRRKQLGAGCWAFMSFFLLTLLVGLTALLYFYTPLSEFINGMVASPTAYESPAAISVTGTAADDASPTAGAVSTVTPTSTRIRPPTLTPTPTETPTPAPTPLGGGTGEIAFVSMRTGSPQVYIMDLDGGNLRQVTNQPGGACQPDFSPDGLQLVFVSPCPEKDEGVAVGLETDLFLIDPDGSELTALPTGPGEDFDPAWSPDGTRIAYASRAEGYAQIYVMKLADLTITRLTETPFDQPARMPAWSPSSTQIAFTLRQNNIYQIWYMTDNGQNQVKLIVGPADVWDLYPAWSPDGETILFTRTDKVLDWGSLNYILYSERTTRQSRRLEGGLFAIDPAYSPDGNWLVFEGADGDQYDIFLMTSDGEQRAPLTTDPAYDFDPVWRPAP